MEYVFVGIALCVVAIAGIIASENAKAKARAEAKKAYDLALDQYRQQPTSATRRQSALDAGRRYSNLMRDSKGLVVYDEVAIKNDLDAAGAGAHEVVKPTPQVVQPAPAKQLTVTERLRNLDELRDNGVVTESEYAEQRTAIIKGI